MSLHHCGADHQGNAVAVALCNFEDTIKADLVTYAAARGIDAVAATDLWAHLREIRDDGSNAYRLARKVIDLGWRLAGGVA